MQSPENAIHGTDQSFSVCGSFTATGPTDLTASAPGAAQRYCLRDILVTNSSTTAGVLVTIYSASTVLWEGYAKAEGGWVFNFSKALKAGTNEKLRVGLSGAATTVYVCVNGYIEHIPATN